MSQESNMYAPRLKRDGRVLLRLTVKFRRRQSADEDRARVQDALVRAHGFQAIVGLTGPLARNLGRFRCYVSRQKVGPLKRRLWGAVKDGGIALWIGGVRI